MLQTTSEDEKKLLRYLVLRPVLTKASGAAAQIVKAAQCTPGQEILATIDRGQRSLPYTYEAKGPEGLLYVLSWTGIGQLRMVVSDSSGRIIQDLKGFSPLKFETTATPGKWTCTVEAAAVPHDNFPYVLTLATHKHPASPAITAPLLLPQPSASASLWPCYVVIDCSRRASDIAPAIGQGMSAFLRGLAMLPSGSVAPAVSFVESREGKVTVPVPRQVAQLGPLNLSCRGESALRPALCALEGAFSRSEPGYCGRPFVVMLLVGHPQDIFQTEARNLKNMASQGRINMVSIGLGTDVSDDTLCNLASIPLRITDPTVQNCVASCEWLIQVAASIVAALSQPTGKSLILPPLPRGVQWLRRMPGDSC